MATVKDTSQQPTDLLDYPDLSRQDAPRSKKKRVPVAPANSGRTLVEVFSVVINNTSGKPRGIYGTVAIGKGLEELNIYKRGKDDYELLEPGAGNCLLLTGPDKDYMGYMPFQIRVDLKDKDTDDVFSHGWLDFNTYHPYYNFNEPSSRGVNEGNWDYLFSVPTITRADNEDVKVNSVVIKNAAWTNVEVMLTKLEAAADVFGQITAWTECFGDENSVLLFHKEKGTKEEDLKVISSPGGGKFILISLLRSGVVVPFNSSLSVRANLHNGDDELIASGEARFVLDTSVGVLESSIPANYGEIRVKISWKF